MIYTEAMEYIVCNAASHHYKKAKKQQDGGLRVDQWIMSQNIHVFEIAKRMLDDYKLSKAYCEFFKIQIVSENNQFLTAPDYGLKIRIDYV